jgi:predicted ATPase
VTAGLASRPSEDGALEEFLDSACSAPSGLLVEGEAGIGKTTLWLAGLERARDRGFQVLSARAAGAESVLAYTALADLLTGLDHDAWADLPDPQRMAIDRVLSRDQSADVVTDQRAVAAAFLSVVERLTDDGPALLTIDDLQWLDPSSAHVIGFAARRLSGPVGFLATVRTETNNSDAISWLQLPRPDAIQ